MTQEKFDELLKGEPLEQSEQAAFLYYNIIVTALNAEGITKIKEHKQVNFLAKNIEDFSSVDCSILLSHIQHFFNLKGYKTKPYKDKYTAYIFHPDSRIVGILIENDFEFL